MCPDSLGFFPCYAGLAQELLEHTGSLVGWHPIPDHFSIAVHYVPDRLVGCPD